MRLLHTADWHIGRMLRGRSRLDEQQKALDEVLEIAVREKVDCLLVAGDVFDSQAPPAEAERLVYGFFAGLAAKQIPAVVIAGNHDHPRRFEALRPLIERMRIHVRPFVKPPGEGGVIEFTAGSERALIAVVPFVPEHKLLDAALMMGAQADRSAAYADRMAGMVEALSSGFTASTVNILLGHVYIAGARAAGSERAIHLAHSYALTPQRFPASASYIALGHLHRPQQIEAPSPMLYSGSLLQLDFGEQGQQKRVVLVDASPGKTARLESIALASGCDLREVKGTLVELQKRAGELANDGFLKVTVKLETFRPGVADEVREMLPNAVDVQIELPERTDRAGDAQPLTALTPEDLFDRFYRAEYGDPGTPEDLLALFKKLYAEVADAPRSA